MSYSACRQSLSDYVSPTALELGGIDMKTFKYIGLAGLTMLTVSSLAVVKSAMAIEKAKYTVLEKEDDFELRQYEAQIVAETFVEEYIQKRGLTKKGGAVWARYDPPFMPWFLRRNEVLIPIEQF
jgi:hypothetical protein